MATPFRRRFRRRCGGHAFGNLRQAFESLVEFAGFNPNQYPETFEVEGETWNTQELIGKFWNCVDIMPGTVCDSLELPRGSTYAQGVRTLRR